MDNHLKDQRSMQVESALIDSTSELKYQKEQQIGLQTQNIPSPNKYHISSYQNNDKYWDGPSPNADFYLGSREGSNGMKILKLLQLQGKYTELERNHSYIQWLFPNHYASAFNHNSYPLTKGDVRKMKENEVSIQIQIFLKDIRQRYLQGLYMFLDFLGLCFNKEDKIQIIDDKGEKRLNKALHENTHNILRIRRLLASLLALEFNKEAQELCNFLKSFDGSKKLYDKFYKYYDEKGTHFEKEYIEGKGNKKGESL